MSETYDSTDFFHEPKNTKPSYHELLQELLNLREQNAELHQEIREQISAYDYLNEKQGEILERNDELKEQNRLLIENSERLANELKMQDRISKENDGEFDGGSMFVDNVLNLHTALMKQVKGK